ncbi:type I restriction-modification system specificity subunit [Thauera sp. 28]|uniref:restriction endonuclease subunit S n=1 Tax=Thauera sp. 28 TaxID=303682 RepID=UPI0002CDA130|nr:restriction endonuclease subunit S [Thauera sp. 28]ENO93719.1 type I restriction-modification system specificity subunit [Thauera sp. 28]
MQRYESYKSSGVEWLGEIPTHWDVRPGFTCFKENKDRNKGLVEKTVLSLSYGRIVIKPEEKLTGLVPESFESYQLIKPGDIVIRTTDLQNDQTSLRVGYAKDKGMITSAYLGLRCHPEINPAYVFRLLESYDALKVFYGMGSGLRQNIDFWDFKRLPVPLPPRDEQDRIVAFLDQKVAEVDAAIAKKERLIELLGEQREGLISRAVLIGLNEQVELRKSSVKWLKNIPKNWEELPCRYLFREVTRRDRDGSEQKLSVTQRNGLVPTDQMAEHSTQAQSFDEFKLCHVGDLVLNKYKAHLGVFWAAKVRGIITNNYTVFRPTKKAFPPYFELLFHTKWMCEQFSSVVYGVVDGMMPLYTKDFYSVQTVCPPLHEQQEIVSYCDEITRKIDSAIAQEERAIQLLRELKTTLVASYVMGKAQA